MSLQSWIESHGFVMGEGSLYERLRRDPAVRFDQHIAHAGLIYDPKSREVLIGVHRQYLDIGRDHGIAMLTGSPTWRANKERVARSAFAGTNVNRDAMRFMIELRQEHYDDGAPIRIAGQCGPKGDAYRPEEAPDTETAEAFHRHQIEELAEGGAEFLMALTLPAFPEALGMARAMAVTGLPYVISFVIRPDGTLLDGTGLDDAIERIDIGTSRPPDTYNVNCVHASVFASALTVLARRNPAARSRVSGLHANTSARSPEELDGLDVLETEAPGDFGANMWKLRIDFGATVLGGCCGTSTAHMAALARLAASDQLPHPDCPR